MIFYRKIFLSDSNDTLLEIEYDSEDLVVRLNTSGGYVFIIPVEEWKQFLSTLEDIKLKLVQ